MVVLIHIVQKLQQYYDHIQWISDWFNLGLVLFFVISAFLYSKREIETRKLRWILHRYLELTGPAFFTVIAALLIFHATYSNVTTARMFSAIVSGLGFEAFLSDGWIFVQYWFITYILVCYITIPLIQRIDFKALKEIQFWCGLAFVSLVLQAGLSLIGKISGIPTLSWGVLLRFYMPYALFKRYDNRSIQKPMNLLSGLSVLCIAGVCAFRYVIDLNGFWVTISELMFIYTQTLAGTVFFYWLYVLFSKIKENSKLIKITDSYSFPVYLTHCLFIGYSTSVIDKYENHFLGITVALICTVVASVFVKLIAMPLTKRIEKIILK